MISCLALYPSRHLISKQPSPVSSTTLSMLALLLVGGSLSMNISLLFFAHPNDLKHLVSVELLETD